MRALMFYFFKWLQFNSRELLAMSSLDVHTTTPHEELCWYTTTFYYIPTILVIIGAAKQLVRFFFRTIHCRHHKPIQRSAHNLDFD